MTVLDVERDPLSTHAFSSTEFAPTVTDVTLMLTQPMVWASLSCRSLT